MERPIDSVTSSVLKLQIAQRAVNALVQELVDRVSADPFKESSQPDVRLRLSELRAEVDGAMDELIDALAPGWARSHPNPTHTSRSRAESAGHVLEQLPRMEAVTGRFER